ncbi:ATP-binding protein [uncultured Sulfuricurvum sp.]|uniref:ATP-binding protein n=1 Tax=uncultured Sulfuricurvum sp. TaxID=430693 RepID=UPI00260375A5|nr:ATP-binding protein [uncultured Sulfuricurvum sp.]
MQLCVGQVARAEQFWPRDTEINRIWNTIESGGHILIAAPRRVGKTSVMYKIYDEPREGYAVAFVDVESADNEHEFWHKLFNTLTSETFISQTHRYTAKLATSLRELAGKIRKVSTSGIEFGDGATLDYAAAFEKFVTELQIDKKLIIMVDEFAQAVENIIKYQSKEQAESFLRTARSLRQNPKILEKVTFLYAGSIGLEGVAARIGATKSINDLNSIKIPPLLREDASAFTYALSEGMRVEGDVIRNLLDKIEWLIPFYIQLILQEAKAIDKEALTNENIDRAITAALQHKNHFEHWKSKLKEAFEPTGYNFAKEVLNIISDKHTIKSSAISNLISKHDLDHDIAKEIVHTLVYDGYINNNDDPKVYRFNSPILRMWWYNNVAN